MGRSRAFRDLTRTLRTAAFAEHAGISTSEALARRAEAEHAADKARASRRSFLAGMGVAAAAGALASFGRLGRAAAAPAPPPSVSIGIVGAGLAGLVCADNLLRSGIRATLYEASSRAGGRCWSLGGYFPGQVAERGGELIDNLHKTMLGYAQEFGLALEDMEKQPGEVFYHFNGQRYPESVVVDEYRAFVPRMRADLQTLSGAPSAEFHNSADVTLDNINLREYLVTRGAGPIVRKAIEESYLAEYGREPEEQSCLNFLLFIHADRRSRFTPFGVYSDERFHVTGGNQQITDGIRARLAGQIAYGHRLARAAGDGTGRVVLGFEGGGSATHDAVVIAVPFSVLRGVELHASLGLPAWKRYAINNLGYGDNAKMMIGFGGPVWRALGASGAAYSDLENHQTTWETNPTMATADHAILTDYSGGERGATLNPKAVQTEAERFLVDCDKVFPGARAAATRDSGGRVLAHLEHWPSNPLSRGSYTCYLPGQFTTIADNEGKAVGNLHFAGEHADSFYSWQGFMEGACLSGVRAAGEILQKIKVGALG